MGISWPDENAIFLSFPVCCCVACYVLVTLFVRVDWLHVLLRDLAFRLFPDGMHLLRQNVYLQCVDLARTDSNICSLRTLFKTTCAEDIFALLDQWQFGQCSLAELSVGYRLFIILSRRDGVQGSALCPCKQNAGYLLCIYSSRRQITFIHHL